MGIVERPVHKEYITEREVIHENYIEKPTERIVEIETEVDETINASLIRRRNEYNEYFSKNEFLVAEIRRLEIEIQKISAVKDRFHECAQLRRRITELEIQLSQKSTTQHRGSVREKITTVSYVENPQAHALRMEIESMRQQNKSMQEKIKFQDTRIAYGSSNYKLGTEQTKTVGGTRASVRELSKNTVNPQNRDVVISHANI